MVVMVNHEEEKEDYMPLYRHHSYSMTLLCTNGIMPHVRDYLGTILP